MDSEKPGKTQTGSQEAEKPSELLDTISFAAFELDARIFRTLWDSLLRTPTVAIAGAEGDYSRYLSPIRVFIALFGFQFVVAALIQYPLAGSIKQLTFGVDPAVVDAWLASARPNAEGVIPPRSVIDGELESLASLMLWPITILSSLPFLLMLKLYKLKVPLWGHLQFYLVPTNASFILMIAGIPMLLTGEPSESGSWALFIGWIGVALIVFFVCMGRLIVRFYSQTIAGAVFRILGLFALAPVTFIISTICQMLTIYWILESQFDLSLLELMQAAAEAAASPP